MSRHRKYGPQGVVRGFVMAAVTLPAMVLGAAIAGTVGAWIGFGAGAFGGYWLAENYVLDHVPRRIWGF